MDDKRGARNEDEETIEPPASDLGPEHCPSCGGTDFYDLLENGETVLVCADCLRRTYPSA